MESRAIPLVKVMPQASVPAEKNSPPLLDSAHISCRPSASRPAYRTLATNWREEARVIPYQLSKQAAQTERKLQPDTSSIEPTSVKPTEMLRSRHVAPHNTPSASSSQHRILAKRCLWSCRRRGGGLIVVSSTASNFLTWCGPGSREPGCEQRWDCPKGMR
jgi:hypothetical protein